MLEIIEKIKSFLAPKIDVIFLFLVIIFGSFIVWGFIELKQKPKFETKIEQLQLVNIKPKNPIGELQTATPSKPAIIVGNKNSKIYHLDSCPGALKMLSENKVFFNSVAMAINAGYRAAKNCPQLEYLK